MFDTHAIARALTESGIPAPQADAITDAVRSAAEHDNAAEPPATARELAAGLAAVRTDLAALEARLYRFLLLQAAGIVGLTVAIIRLLGLG